MHIRYFLSRKSLNIRSFKGVYIRFWPTLHIWIGGFCVVGAGAGAHAVPSKVDQAWVTDLNIGYPSALTSCCTHTITSKFQGRLTGMITSHMQACGVPKLSAQCIPDASQRTFQWRTEAVPPCHLDPLPVTNRHMENESVILFSLTVMPTRSPATSCFCCAFTFKKSWPTKAQTLSSGKLTPEGMAVSVQKRACIALYRMVSSKCMASVWRLIMKTALQTEGLFGQRRKGINARDSEKSARYVRAWGIKSVYMCARVCMCVFEWWLKRSVHPVILPTRCSKQAAFAHFQLIEPNSRYQALTHW